MMNNIQAVMRSEWNIHHWHLLQIDVVEYLPVSQVLREPLRLNQECCLADRPEQLVLVAM
jgi:hypothetical protein